MLPSGGYLRPFELPVFGTLGFQFDEMRSLQSIDVDLFGGPGSLEVVDYYGDNLKVDAVRARGLIDASDQTVRLEEAVIQLADGQVALAGTLHMETERVALNLHARLSNTDLSRLLPRWFAGLPAMLENPHDAGPYTTVLELDGNIWPDAGLVDLTGRILIRDKPTGADEYTDGRRVFFRLSGQTRAPQLLVRSTPP